MSKREFLSLLRQALTGEVSPNVIEQNIKYYEQYISGSSFEQEKIIEELGDPRLIAKTIIEVEKIAREKNGYNRRSNGFSGQYQGFNAERDDEWPNSGTSNSFFSNLSWRSKVALSIGIVVLILIIAILSRFIIRFLFVFGVPIILLLLAWSLFRKRY